TGLASKVKSSGVYRFRFLALHLNGRAFHVLSGGTICGALALISPFTVSNFFVYFVDAVSFVLLVF
ncbi:TPA: hypothetical protein ACF3XQ_004548, partial [Vibrio parahaemolyticus]